MAEKILSVSIAAYNLGDMIDQCIASFAEAKHFDQIELIITNDGSKDDTLERALSWQRKYPDSIKVINKKNEGAGSTVNSGIRNATGKYFRMVDGDDWVRSENLDSFIEFLASCNSDMVVSDYVFYDNSTSRESKPVTFDLPVQQEFLFDEHASVMPHEMHAITYKTSVLKDHVVLDNGFYTDVEYLLFPLDRVKTVSYFNKVIYIYRVGQMNQSVSPQSRIKNFSDHQKVMSHTLDWFQNVKGNLSEPHKKFIANRLALLSDSHITALLLFPKSKEKKNEIKAFIARLSDYPEIMEIYRNNRKYHLLKHSGYLCYGLARKIVLKKENNGANA